MLSQRSLLAAIIVLATVLFVVGVSIERSEGPHDEEPSAAHVEAGEGEGSEAGEGAAHEEGEASAAAEGTDHEETGEDEKVLGVDLESTPSIVLAALVSLALALGAWLRPDSAALLGFVALAMLAFAVFDIAEIGHQIEESEAGLVVIAALVAGLHLAASAVAFTMRRQLEKSPG